MNEQDTPETPATGALTDDELSQVAGGTEGPGSPTDGTSKASPRLF
jgi:hypothetical protein